MKVSEILLMAVFFVIEKSMFTSLGPLMELRPALPRRFEQYTTGLVGGNTGTPVKVPHWGASGEEADTVGSVKQFELI